MGAAVLQAEQQVVAAGPGHGGRRDGRVRLHPWRLETRAAAGHRPPGPGGGRRGQWRRAQSATANHPHGQTELLERGRIGYVFSYGFLLTDKLGDAAEIERWHRQRAHIEERIKEAKNGCGLIHLPKREAAANRAWQAAVVVAHNLVSMLAVEVAAGNRQRLHERVATAVADDDLRHQAPERVQPQPPTRPALVD